MLPDLVYKGVRVPRLGARGSQEFGQGFQSGISGMVRRLTIGLMLCARGLCASWLCASWLWAGGLWAGGLWASGLWASGLWVSGAVTALAQQSDTSMLRVR